MYKKLLKVFVTIILLLFIVNLFHNDIASIWHKTVHIVHSEEHNHHHHSFDSDSKNNNISSKETHHHHIISKFIASFETKHGVANEGEVPIRMLKDIKHFQKTTFDHQLYLNTEHLKYKTSIDFYKTFMLSLDSPPPQV